MSLLQHIDGTCVDGPLLGGPRRLRSLVSVTNLIIGTGRCSSPSGMFVPYWNPL